MDRRLQRLSSVLAAVALAFAVLALLASPLTAFGGSGILCPLCSSKCKTDGVYGFCGNVTCPDLQYVCIMCVCEEDGGTSCRCN